MADGVTVQPENVCNYCKIYSEVTNAVNSDTLNFMCCASKIQEKVSHAKDDEVAAILMDENMGIKQLIETKDDVIRSKDVIIEAKDLTIYYLRQYIGVLEEKLNVRLGLRQTFNESSSKPTNLEFNTMDMGNQMQVEDIQSGLVNTKQIEKTPSDLKHTDETKVMGKQSKQNQTTVSLPLSNNSPKASYASVIKSVSNLEKDMVIQPRKHKGNEKGSDETVRVVTNKKRINNKNKVILGTANNLSIKGAVKQGHVHAFGFDPKVNKDEIVTYLKENNIEGVSCEKMQSRRPDHYSSFKISFPMENLERIKSPNLWPVGVKVNRFFHYNINSRTKTKE